MYLYVVDTIWVWERERERERVVYSDDILAETSLLNIQGLTSKSTLN